MTTVAGSGYLQNDDGTGSSAHFYYPRDSTILGNILYVATRNNMVRAIDISTDPGLNEGVVTTLTSMTGNNSAITNDGTNLYVASTRHIIYKIALSGPSYMINGLSQPCLLYTSPSPRD